MKKLFLLFITAFHCQILVADNILTSTTFSEAYQDAKFIKKTKKVGQLNKKLIKYILKKKNPVDMKLAIINELGWDFTSKKNNSDIILEYVVKRKMYKDYKDLTDHADAEVLICIAYMKALEDYGNVRSARALANRAVLRDHNKSFAINLVSSIIDAQFAFNREFNCRAYKICDKVRNNENLIMDMEESAVKIVFDYVELYKSYCKN